MKKETKKEILPASSLKAFQKSFASVEKEQINVLEELQVNIKELSQKIDRSVDVNINLQTKIVDMMEEMTSLVVSFQDIAKFLRGSPKPENIPTIEEQEEVMSPSIEPIVEIGKIKARPDITAQLKELVGQNRELTETLKGLENELKKSTTRDAIKKALEKSQLK